LAPKARPFKEHMGNRQSGWLRSSPQRIHTLKLDGKLVSNKSQRIVLLSPIQLLLVDVVGVGVGVEQLDMDCATFFGSGKIKL
jgi:hypothetical protein